MTATEIDYLKFKRMGKRYTPSWNESWSNFSDADIEEACEGRTGQAYTDCVNKYKGSSNYSPDFKDRPWVQEGLSTIGSLLSGYGQQNQFGASQPVMTTPQRAPMSTGTKVAIGVGIAAAIGITIYLIKK